MLEQRSVTSLGDCPVWLDNVPASMADKYASLVADSLQRLDTLARDRHINCRDIRREHAWLFDDLVPMQCYAGNFRHESTNPTLKCLAVNVRVGFHVGEDYRSVPAAMERLCESHKQSLETIEASWGDLSPRDRVKAFAAITAELVGGFIRIHPFINGNGRMSRLLWAWCCSRMSVKQQVRIYPRPDRGIDYERCMAECMQGRYARLANAIVQMMARANQVPQPPDA